mmetsp:Transcript_99894/g.223881  ORF Transcript_99894/g.223881 Transcript_99894/m.223881 type:complete len:213 (+) Transcript_99894:136-774(+)
MAWAHGPQWRTSRNSLRGRPQDSPRTPSMTAAPALWGVVLLGVLLVWCQRLPEGGEASSHEPAPHPHIRRSHALGALQPLAESVRVPGHEVVPPHASRVYLEDGNESDAAQCVQGDRPLGLVDVHYGKCHILLHTVLDGGEDVLHLLASTAKLGGEQNNDRRSPLHDQLLPVLVCLYVESTRSRFRSLRQGGSHGWHRQSTTSRPSTQKRFL